MVRKRARLGVGAMLLAATGALCACAARRPAPEPPAPPPPVATPTPAPTPTPVPPELACGVAADCAMTPYPTTVQSVGDCYCPTCPTLRNAVVARANEVSWQRLCGDWSARARCVAPMCSRPPSLLCTE